MAKVPEKLFKFFFYGTLKKGLFNHSFLTNVDNGFARYLGEGKMVEKYPLIISTMFNIPFLLDRPGWGHHVKGEVYEVDEKMMSKLDELENYPTDYDREIQNIEMDKEVVECWVYLIRNFPSYLLEKELQTCYSISNLYKPRCGRDPNINLKDDINY